MVLHLLFLWGRNGLLLCAQPLDVFLSHIMPWSHYIKKHTLWDRLPRASGIPGRKEGAGGALVEKVANHSQKRKRTFEKWHEVNGTRGQKPEGPTGWNYIAHKLDSHYSGCTGDCFFCLSVLTPVPEWSRVFRLALQIFRARKNTLSQSKVSWGRGHHLNVL